ncbi:hypothetical protein [Lachnoclostridium phytofermentans]|uniref:hypothetical protein n=1 Tax=Lachnoclostridium phytofermentans TaxID=66219 RepID=UPI0012DF3033|nr:hypothetical protein [Lachnoclostridium phytofermentans]
MGRSWKAHMESIERGGYLMAQYTENYNLELQQGTDFINVNGLNTNFNTIDGELKNLEDNKAPKAHKHMTSDITDFPTALPADGGDADTVNGHTVNADVPSNAKFTDTVYTHPSTHPASMITGLPTSLPASDVYSWAKQANKPAYSASEVGALAVNGKATSAGTADNATNANNSDKIDNYHVQVVASVPASTVANTIYFVTE